MKERVHQAITVAALIALVFYLPAFILWCGPLVYFYNEEICEQIGASNLWHLILLACGVVLVAFHPRAMGVRFGRIRSNLWLIGLVSVIAWFATWVGVLIVPDHPFQDAPSGMYLMTPVGEELIFRGFAYTALLWAFRGKTTRFGISYAVLGSALLFGGWHISMAGTISWSWVWLQAAYTTLAGLLLGVLRERTGSIVPCVTAHMGSNFIVAMM
jgi:membrane protease YdiL (CAAX protease family)